MVMISESVKLLGMLVNTNPFEYVDNKVTVNFEGYIDIKELENMKDVLEKNKEIQSDISDSEIAEINDSIYFIDCIIENLKSKLNN